MASNKVTVTGGTGLTSCLSVRLDNVIAYWMGNNKFPDEIDSSKQFLHYKDFDGQDVSKRIMGEYVKPHFKATDFNHGFQYGWLNDMDIPLLSQIAKVVCNPSEEVLIRLSRYKCISEGRTAILYRGNDKGLEINRTPYHAMEIMANESGATRFLLQTDEEDFYQFFIARFPDTVAFSEIPRISKDPDSYVMPPEGQRVQFAIDFLAALIALGLCEKVLMNTGNTGLWLALYRGYTSGIFQWHGKEGTYKKF